MSVTTTHRPASTDEIAAEIDRRGQVIEHLEVRNDELTKALIGAERAITEFYRYYTGGETRGSYDGRPEREGLWKAMRAARSTLAALVPAPQPVGEVREGWKSLSCDDQFALATQIAANLGYELTPEPPHPDTPRDNFNTELAWRYETDAENIARDMKEGRFPQRSDRQKVPAAPSSQAQEDGR